jgi:hypothetical protein
MLADITRRDDYLCVRYIIVRQENNFEEIAGSVIVVDHFCHFVDEFDDTLGVDVTWSGFSTKHDNSRNHLFPLLRRHSFNCEIPMNYVKDVH